MAHRLFQPRTPFAHSSFSTSRIAAAALHQYQDPTDRTNASTEGTAPDHRVGFALALADIPGPSAPGLPCPGWPGEIAIRRHRRPRARTRRLTQRRTSVRYGSTSPSRLHQGPPIWRSRRGESRIKPRIPAVSAITRRLMIMLRDMPPRVLTCSRPAGDVRSFTSDHELHLSAVAD